MSSSRREAEELKRLQREAAELRSKWQDSLNPYLGI
jgi:hypothetical protein